MTDDRRIKFSVAICVYHKDNPNHFDMALKSVTFDQIVQPDELVIVADGPLTPELDEIIEKYKNSYHNVKVKRLKKNSGHGIARRVSINTCSCEYIALMDADDISVPERFKLQTEYLKKYPVDVLGGNIAEFEGNLENISGYRVVPEKEEDICRYLKKRCPFNQMTVILKKTSVRRVGGYKDWYQNEDYYLWVRMYLEKFVFANIDKVLVNVRVDNGMIDRRGGIKYFKSEMKLQNYMLKKKIISPLIYMENVLKRFILQVIMTPKIRGLAYRIFARSHKVVK